MKPKDVRDWLTEKKRRTPCTDCGRNFHPAAMSFDHVRGLKRFCMTRRPSHGIDYPSVYGATRAELLTEVAKCDIVCLNCHAVREVERRERRVLIDDLEVAHS